MEFSVIVCTYHRPESMLDLLRSLQLQSIPALEIIVVDASSDDQTETLIKLNKYLLPLRYIKAEEENRGLTKQRNLGISLLNPKSEVIVFLDDDVVCERTFMENLIGTFNDTSIVGCDGLITNENEWKPIKSGQKLPFWSTTFDGHYLTLHKRDILRALFGLYPFSLQPGRIPRYGHGKNSLPATNKQYEVDHIMGGITAYRKKVFDKIQFSPFFEGYGLYEDFDFSIRANRLGKLVTNTSAKVSHHHHPAGRPNKFKFGKTVVWNGWYVWRLKYASPGIANIFRWHLITILLAFTLLLSLFSSSSLQRSNAIQEFLGRMTAYLKLIFIQPKIQE